MSRLVHITMIAMLLPALCAFDGCARTICNLPRRDSDPAHFDSPYNKITIGMPVESLERLVGQKPKEIWKGDGDDVYYYKESSRCYFVSVKNGSVIRAEMMWQQW